MAQYTIDVWQDSDLWTWEGEAGTEDEAHQAACAALNADWGRDYANWDDLASDMNGTATRMQGPTEPNPLAQVAEAFGFAEEMTGGGCIALTRYFPGGGSIWLTDQGGLQMPGGAGAGQPLEWMVGVYDSDGPGSDDPLMMRLGSGLSTFTRAVIDAVEIAESAIPTTDNLADEYDEWLTAHGYDEPGTRMDAMELFHELAAKREAYQEQMNWLMDFDSRWDAVQSHEDMQAAIAARG